MLDGAEEQSIRRELMGEGFEPMRVAAERLVERGVTDRAEVARVLGAGPMAKVDAIAAAGAAAPRRDAPAPGDTAPAGGDA
jgi:hypothetical protein